MAQNRLFGVSFSAPRLPEEKLMWVTFSHLCPGNLILSLHQLDLPHGVHGQNFCLGPEEVTDLRTLEPGTLHELHSCPSLESAIEQRGRERKGAPRHHPENSSQKLANFECRFPDDRNGKNGAPFWPIFRRRIWAISGGPFLLLAPLVYC